MSVSLRNVTSCFFRKSRIAAWFSMTPLWTSTTLPAASTWGWAFSTLGRPCVAQRVWATPSDPRTGCSSQRSFSRSTRPTARRRSNPSPFTVTRPALS